MTAGRPARRRARFALAALVLLAAGACDDARRAIGRGFAGGTPHERYAGALEMAGLARTALGRQWNAAADSALRAPAPITLPFRESGYFAATEARAVAYRFPVRRGEHVVILVTSTSADSAHRLFRDLYLVAGSAPPRAVAWGDEATGTMEWDANADGALVLRLQPELLRGVRYTLLVRTTGALAFPVAGHDDRAVQSRFGAERDGGQRLHEGVDIFAPAGTPVLAAAPGVVTSLGNTTLGGLVVWQWDARHGQSLYYAHLSRQVAHEGQRVEIGDTLGLVGNTGNARTTPSHLHFGIYRRGTGAIDPYPWVRTPHAPPPPVRADLAPLGELRRTRVGLPDESVGTLLAARDRRYVVRLADGRLAELPPESLAPLGGLARVASGPALLRESPSVAAPPVAQLARGARATRLGRAGDFCLVELMAGPRGWLPCAETAGTR